MGRLPPSKSYSGSWGTNKPYKSSSGNRNTKPPRGGGGGKKPPGKLCVQVAPIPASFALAMLANAVAQSFIG